MAMDNHLGNSLKEELAALDAWWREAGVDHAFLDAPQRLLAEPEEAAAPAPLAPARKRASEAAPPPAIEPLMAAADLPATLGGFRRWWLDPQMPLPRVGPALAPVGAAGAPLLMLVPMPEADDRDALLQGAEGRLLAGIARAMGLASGEVYRASALPSHITMPDWADLAGRGLAQVTRQHLALAEPHRVLLFGSVLARMLDIAPNANGAELILGERRVPVLATDAPEHLLHHQNRRARLWERLLEWTSSP